MISDKRAALDQLSLKRNREQFCMELITELAESIQEVVGNEMAAGFVRTVGARIGNTMNQDYEEATGMDKFDIDTVANILVDLKRRINGGFRIESFNNNAITLVNDACPFSPKVLGKTSLCEMTSSVFGTIASKHLGYANVEISEAIARGDKRCRVIVHLDPELDIENGRAFFGEAL